MALLGAGFLTLSGHAESIWIEGEAPTRSDVQPHGWYDSVKKDVLSAGGWLSHYGGNPGEASYEIDVASAAKFTVWARMNPVASKPSWRFDGGAWIAIETRVAAASRTLPSTTNPTTALSPGSSSVRSSWRPAGMSSHSVGKGGASNSGGLDCFVLTTDPFIPQGTMKPGGADGGGGSPAEWFPLLADDDPFDPASIIDMSSLVPAPAGNSAFLKSVGKDLRFEDSPQQ